MNLALELAKILPGMLNESERGERTPHIELVVAEYKTDPLTPELVTKTFRSICQERRVSLELS